MLKSKLQLLLSMQGKMSGYEIITDKSAARILGGDCTSLERCASFTGPCSTLSSCGNFTDVQ